MSLIDCLRPKWKRQDPVVREQGVRCLTDQSVLEMMANDDPSDAVRLAAVETLVAQDALTRLAMGKSPLAAAAITRVTDPAYIVDIAFRAALPQVRELAVDRIYDGVTLERIASSDTERSVRLKARMKCQGGDQTREFIRRELAKLQPAPRDAEGAAEFRGTLDEVCHALVGDRRFRINGRLTPSDSEPGATPAPNDADAETEAPETCAQFLAFKREENVAENTERLQSFFEIRVWRTDQEVFQYWVDEKSLKMAQDSKWWNRVSQSAAIPFPMPRDKVPIA